MKPEIMRKEYSLFRDRVVDLFMQLSDLTLHMGDKDLRDIAAGLIKNVNAPFLFVVVGEVKSGKSSFINALLGEELCAVAPDPCTDVIQKIVYADEPFERTISDQVREVGQPSEILREIAIVDTPGTNSIIEHHQEITERFIPESDLVLFVFSAVNPYSKTAWDLFRLVHANWHKKILFILQQADRATDQELAVNEDRVVQYARGLGVQTPRVFRVSAKRAMEGAPDSGIEQVWEFVQDTVTGGRHYLLKMESLLSTAFSVLDRVGEDLKVLQQGLTNDRAEAEKIQAAMKRGREISLREIQILNARLLQSYVLVADEIVEEFEEGLSVPNLVRNSFKGFFSRKNAFKQWLEELTERFNEKLTREVDVMSREASEFIAEHIVLSMEELLSDLKEAGKTRPSMNIGSVTRRRFKVVEEVVVRLATLMQDKSMSERLQPKGLRQIGDRTLLGGFITALGAIIAGAAHAAVFDVTGGIVTTFGALLALNTIVFKRRSAVKKFREGFAQGRIAFQEELETRLAEQIGLVYEELEGAFAPFFENIAQREEDFSTLSQKIESLAEELSHERDRLGSMMS
ncbi:MAG: dynamin family protein [Desulfovibrionales bacterium]